MILPGVFLLLEQRLVFGRITYEYCCCIYDWSTSTRCGSHITRVNQKGDGTVVPVALFLFRSARKNMVGLVLPHSQYLRVYFSRVAKVLPPFLTYVAPTVRPHTQFCDSFRVRQGDNGIYLVQDNTMQWRIRLMVRHNHLSVEIIGDHTINTMVPFSAGYC